MGTILTPARPDLAKKFWEKALSSRDSHLLTLDDQMAYVQCMFVNAEHQKALELLDLLNSQHPKNGEILYNLTKASLMLGDREKALRYSREMVQQTMPPIAGKLLYLRLCMESPDPATRGEGEDFLAQFLSKDDSIEKEVLWSLAEIPNFERSSMQELKNRLSKLSTTFKAQLQLATWEVESALLSSEEAYSDLSSIVEPTNFEACAMLADWCNLHHLPLQALEWMPKERAMQNINWLLTRIKSLGQVAQWKEVVALISEKDCPLEIFWKHLLLAEAYSAMGQLEIASHNWHRAKAAVDNSPALQWVLIPTGEKLGLDQECNQLLFQMVSTGIDPTRISAYFFERAVRRNDYAPLPDLLNQLREVAPLNPDIQNDWAYFTLLFTPDHSEAKEMAETLCEEHPGVLRYHMTWALGKIQEGKPKEVLGRFQQFQVDWETLHPRWRLILALALAGAGEKEQGAHYLTRLDLRELNPKEQELLSLTFGTTP